MVYILRSTDVNPDPRVQKYIDFLNSNNLKFKIIAWNRGSEIISQKNFIYFNKKSEFEQGVKNILNLISFNLFIFKILYRHNKNVNIIHACDFDTILPSLLIKLLFRKKIVYDIFDWYVDSRNISKPFAYFFYMLEMISIKFSEMVVICENERINQIPFHVNKSKFRTLPNIPSFTFQNLKSCLLTTKKDTGIINLSYVGVLAYNRGIEDILNFTSQNKNYTLDIAGFGVLDSLVSKFSTEFSNINFHGKVKYTKGLKIMSKSDLIIALYYTKNKNHLFAAPNKYYESLFLEIPLITSKNTLVGNKVEYFDTGYTFDEKNDNMNDFFSSISNIKSKVNNCKVEFYNSKVQHTNFFDDYYKLFFK